MERRSEGGLQIWIFTPSTVENALSLTQTNSALEQSLPNWITHWRFLGDPLWRWVALAVLLPIALAFGRLLGGLAMRLLTPIHKRLDPTGRCNFPRTFSGPLQGVISPRAISLRSRVDSLLVSGTLLRQSRSESCDAASRDMAGKPDSGFHGCAIPACAQNTQRNILAVRASIDVAHRQGHSLRSRGDLHARKLGFRHDHGAGRRRNRWHSDRIGRPEDCGKSFRRYCDHYRRASFCRGLLQVWRPRGDRGRHRITLHAGPDT